MKTDKTWMMVAFGMILIGYLLGLISMPDANPSLSARFEQGMIGIISGVVELLGSLILIVLTVQAVRKSRGKRRCSNCGEMAQLKTDQFCRACGQQL